MDTNTDTPATAHTPVDPGTGAGADATTAPTLTERVQAFSRINVEWLELTAAARRADAAMYESLARAHQADPFLSEHDRRMLIDAARQRAEAAHCRAEDCLQRAAGLRADLPPPAPLQDPPLAVVVLTIERDRIQQTARLVMGGTHTSKRTWNRVGPSSWRSADPEWLAAEDRIGLELAEWSESVTLPTRVADMLPRPANPDAAAKAAEAVRHG